jgi:small conductance mechanosensitive channel
MTNFDINSILPKLLEFGGNLVGALIVWFIGRWAIGFAIKLLAKALKSRQFDSTVTNYLTSFIGVLLQVVLIVAILGMFGINTTSFAALLAAAGVAIGAAWSGLLANFAAGLFLVLFRPFKVGDVISAGGVTGKVVEIGIFATRINTLDNIMTIVGNNKIFSDNIQNFSENAYRRVDLIAQLNHNVDYRDAIDRLQQKVAKVPNVLASPAPILEILEFNFAGPVLAVRPFCSNDDYWQVYFDVNRVIKETFGEAGYPVPEQHYAINSLRPQDL